MKLLLLFISLSYSLLITAQPRAIGSPTPFIQADSVFITNAVWSPNDLHIAFTGEKFNGIWIFNAVDSSYFQLTDDQGAGFGFAWSADGNSILARSRQKINGVNYCSIKVYDTQLRSEFLIDKDSLNIYGIPAWTMDETKVAYNSSQGIKRSNSGKQALKVAGMASSEAIMFGGDLITTTNKKVQQVSFPQFDGRHVFNRRVSPCGSKVVFQVSGLGLHVSDVDGNNVLFLGYGEQAAWMPDNQFVVVTMVKDDGKIITEGKLFAVDTLTGSYYVLTENELVIALNPSVSPNGKNLLYTNPTNGNVYILGLK